MHVLSSQRTVRRDLIAGVFGGWACAAQAFSRAHVTQRTSFTLPKHYNLLYFHLPITISPTTPCDSSMLDVDDLRVRGIRALVPSACLIEELPDEPAVYEHVSSCRREVAQVVCGDDSRLLVVVGPVSTHDPIAAMEYARLLVACQVAHKADLLIVMRVFLDEPAGGAGYWSGAMYDPDLDGSFRINKGLRQARQLLLDINRLGLPVGCLYVDTITPQFVADLVSWS